VVDTTLAAGVNSTLVCLQTGAATDPAYPNVLAVGGTLQFTLSASNGDTGFAVVSGPADWSATPAAAGFTLDVTGKKMTITDADANTVPVLKITGTGSVQVAWYTADAGTLRETYYITAVSSCVAGVNVANSYVQVTDSATKIDTAANWIDRQTATTQGTASTTNDDATDLNTSLDVRTNFANTQEAYIAVRARDAYTANISGTGTNLLTVVCDNGARVGGTDYNFASDATFSAATTSGGDNNIAVSQAKDGVASSTTCTVSVNGVELAKKKINWAGDLASITIAASRLGVVGDSNDGRITYVCKDAAGNAISCAIGTTSNNHTGVSNVTLTTSSGGVMTTAVAEYSSATYAGQAFGFGANPYTVGTGYATYGCNDYGKANISVYAYSAGGVKVTSNPLEIMCEENAINTYTVSLDKATYKQGDVATLTITALGVGGLPTAYGTTLGAGMSIAMPGMTAVVAPATTDTESVSRGGVWTYTYTVNVGAEGSYNGAVKLATAYTTSPQYNKATTVAYTIAASGAVSNADVLKAIVSLIASINKQIAALQKALLKK